MLNLSEPWKIVKKYIPLYSEYGTTVTAVCITVPASQIASQGCDLEGKHSWVRTPCGWLKRAIVHTAAIRLRIIIMVVLLAACFVDQSVTLVVECDRSQEHTDGRWVSFLFQLHNCYQLFTWESYFSLLWTEDGRIETDFFRLQSGLLCIIPGK